MTAAAAAALDAVAWGDEREIVIGHERTFTRVMACFFLTRLRHEYLQCNVHIILTKDQDANYSQAGSYLV